MKIKDVIGIDASKLTLDCCLHKSGAQEVFENTPEAIVFLVDWSIKISGLAKNELLFVFEHTGLYTHQLVRYLSEQGYYFLLVPGLEIKRSLGIARGKDDRADAKRIALYGYRIREEARPYQMPKESLISLKRLMSMRRKLVSQRAGHIATLGEQIRVLNNELGPILLQVQRDIIGVLDVQITKIEKELDRLIEQDPELQIIYRLLVSIKGIGAVTARFMIVHTVGFTAFKSWRKFASYCGIAPFPNRSGTSIRGRTKVSQLANKEGKTLLNLCAGSAIQCNPEMKAYYTRRIDAGKNKMSTLNIIRNKLLARAFAVVVRGTPYVNTMGYIS
ncbi:IS110 family RNA-guided transposase [Arenibacter algicola]|jgi:transposase|uniref:Transposase IS116/IS110/IS902 family protein n=1 Tax=Arenibacter algicola TaxID=616991 RepID=A0A221V158_9FLAO|nr:IS110 family transposase [Arenibacter algicola]ASO03617.1 transposase IS116/IS110/IS902 family protein [Arenibacter algicola]ASO06130.1 transposase IS116/IS110/IS902 family protein [Arenibacter algicola]ASO07105.1 transposase IS116/IS110/IS902 family protein [Arenibacter algicola]ASO07118.1 transposase IS116/IS110/IS902 family protein [Arenibacter algicola]ASO07958.1 transposase IS116/IS110/IS902 family protein [Arenibacter algicola]|tara:strand:- start:143 stop:1138 length:996 start_codon:yes stop_codon:yes gene_type:complete